MNAQHRGRALLAAEEAVGEARTRARILDAAIDCFIQFGNEKTTLNDVARAAGLARQTIYRYFPDRRALLEAVKALEDGRLRAEVARIAEQTATLEEFVAELATARARTSSRYRTRQHLLAFDRGLVQSLFLSRDDTIALIRDLVVPQLRVARRRGELSRGLDVEQAAEWIAITLDSITTMTASATVDLDDPSAIGRFFARHICHGLVAKAPRPKRT